MFLREKERLWEGKMAVVPIPQNRAIGQ